MNVLREKIESVLLKQLESLEGTIGQDSQTCEIEKAKVICEIAYTLDRMDSTRAACGT